MSENPAASQVSVVHSKVCTSGDAVCLMGNLQRQDFKLFEQACAQLRESPAHAVTLDLTRCTYVSSLTIGILVDAVTEMKALGKEVRVLVSPKVARFLHLAHLYHLFSYEIAEPDPS